AREAVDTYLTQVSDNPELKALNLEPLRRELLRTARDFYLSFVQEHPDDPDVLAELGRAYGRLGQITMILESRPRGIDYYLRERDIFEQLLREHPGEVAYQDELAEACLQLGIGYWASQQDEAAEQALQRAAGLWEQLHAAAPQEPDHVYRRVR